MGNTWEVSAWEWNDDGSNGGEGKWQYVSHWRGESLLGAILAMRRAKREGFGCVKLEWR